MSFGSFTRGCDWYLNEWTCVCLILKKYNAIKVEEFRPISVVTSLYKIIAKTSADRLRKVLSSTISKNQRTFIAGRQILDQVLMANEAIRVYRMRKDGAIIFKIDFEKAYDHVDWNFLNKVLWKKSFGFKCRAWIWNFTKNVNFSFLINGRPRGKVSATRGQRQGNPFIPFPFHSSCQHLQ